MTHRLGEALAWAADLHAGQVRKGTQVPYVAHLLAVAALVLDGGGQEDDAIAALLHDALEDTEATRDEIEARFGSQVARVVAACSDTEVQPKPPWRERKTDFLARLGGPDADEHVLLVVAADKIHNVGSMLADHRRVGDASWARFKAGPRDQHWYYREVARHVRSGLGGPMADTLDGLVAQLGALVDAGDGSRGDRS